MNSREPALRLALNVLLVGFICHVSTEIGFAHKLPPHNISSLWPTGAILFSVLVATPTRHWWAYVAAAYFTSVIKDARAGFPLAAIFFVIAGVMEIVGAAWAVRRFAEGQRAFNSLRTLVIYLGVAVVLAPFASAFVAAASAPQNYWFTWRVWFLSEAVAYLMLAPAIITWMSGRSAFARASLARCLEGGLIFGALVSTCARVFNSPTEAYGRIPALVYLPLPLLLLAAVRFGPAGVNTSLVAVAFLSISGAVNGRGPFAASGSASDSVLSLQLFLVTMSIPLMFLATLIEERGARDQAMRILSGRLVSAQEEERRHIARELHDEIGQILTVVKMNLEALRDPGRLTNATASVDTCVQNVDRAIEQARTLAHDLRPAILDDLGLPAALRWFIHQIPEGKPKTHLSLDGSEGKALSAEVSTAAFRIAQEAVTNALRHANAGNVWVSLESGSSSLELCVRDDGLGFDFTARRGSPSMSFGLSSMEERVRLVGGQIEIHSSKGAGTEVRARFPVGRA